MPSILPAATTVDPPVLWHVVSVSPVIVQPFTSVVASSRSIYSKAFGAGPGSSVGVTRIAKPASGAFKKSYLEVVRAIVPWLAIAIVSLMIITYVPEISLCLPKQLYPGIN